MACDTPLTADLPRSSRIGVDALDQVFLMENHDEALRIWRDAEVHQRILVHIDAHHDMWWADDEADVNIGNFICLALRQGLLREAFWVVPDAAFENAKATKPVFKHMKRLLRRYQEGSKVLVEPNRIAAFVLGKRLTICPVSLLPVLREPVLLDIDLDYFVIPRVCYGMQDQHSSLPWCWPNELVNRLRDCGVQSDLVTIVYSVEGGFTPLQWKYLGQELALLLKRSSDQDPELAGMRYLREGAEAEQRGEHTVAESKYRQAQTGLPEIAAAPYRLARLLSCQGRVEEGRLLYAHAVKLDNSYSGPYSNSGFHCYWRDELGTAEQEFRCSLALNPADPYAALGLGLLAHKRKRWQEAERHLRTALALDSSLLDAQRSLGHVLAKLKRTDEAIVALERALKLGLRGHNSLEGPITTNRRRPLSDPWHCDTYARLARLYARKGSVQAAIDALRIAISGGRDSASQRLQLARLYWQRGDWRSAVVQGWLAIGKAPKCFWQSFVSAVRLAENSWALARSGR